MAKKKIDLTGQRFGRLTVIKELPKPKSDKTYQRFYICECDCGKTKKVRYSNLKSGNTKSCGCLRNRDKRKDITGKRFGRLVALKPMKSSKFGRWEWLLQCDCGDEVVVDIGSLTSGNTKSCGCLKSELDRCRMKDVVESSGHGDFQRKDLREPGTRLTSINFENRKKRADNTSGVTGVYWAKRTENWMASITIKKKTIHLGYFENKQDAINARKEAEEKYFKPILEKYDDTEKK